MLVGHARDERVLIAGRGDEVFANGVAPLADGLVVAVSEGQEFPTHPIDIFLFQPVTPSGHSVVTSGIASKRWRSTLADKALTLATSRASIWKGEFKFMTERRGVNETGIAASRVTA